MELSLESDAEALWQDALDLLAAQQRRSRRNQKEQQ